MQNISVKRPTPPKIYIFSPQKKRIPLPVKQWGKSVRREKMWTIGDNAKYQTMATPQLHFSTISPAMRALS